MNAIGSRSITTRRNTSDNAHGCRCQGERQSLPAHLPRVEVVITPEDTVCPCCKGPMHVIGEETAERLDVIPAQYRVLVTRRPIILS